MMRKAKSLTVILLTVWAGCSSCGSKEGNTQQNVAVTSYITLQGCYVADGKKDFPTLTSTSKAGLAVAGRTESYSASPLDLTSGMFCFTGVAGPLTKDDKLLAWTCMDGAQATFDGALRYSIPVSQDGTFSSHVMLGTEKYVSGSSGTRFTLSEGCCVMYVTLKKGYYSADGLTIKANGGEKIAGDVAFDPSSETFSATADAVSVKLPSSVNCSLSSKCIAVMLAPVVLSKGYTITLDTTDGTKTVSSSESVQLEAGECVYTEELNPDDVRKLMACGSSKVYLFDATKVDWGGSYKSGLIWQWDCTSVQGTVAGCKSSSHIDDVGIVNNGKNILVTCSNNNGWCVLLEPDYNVDGKADLLFWTNSSPNAHSAEYLPGGYVAVACSVGDGDCIQLYKVGSNNSPVGSYALTSAHGCVWNEDSQRLYAIGGTSLQIYTWDQTAGKLTLEKTVSTSDYVTGLHDIALVDSNTLILGGYKVATYTISTGKLTSLTWFNSSATNGIKSLNYNPSSQELYYTFAVAATAEGAYDWSSYKIRYTNTPSSAYNASGEKHIIVNDINMYKTRVFNW